LEYLLDCSGLGGWDIYGGWMVKDAPRKYTKPMNTKKIQGEMEGRSRKRHKKDGNC